MKHTILTVLLTLGVVGGTIGGIASVRHHHHGKFKHAQFEEHIADICVTAAERVQQKRLQASPSDQ